MSMPPVLTESARTSARSRTTLSKPINQSPQRNPADVLQDARGTHPDGWVPDRVDLDKSRGSYLYDAATGHRLIDLYGFFGSVPVGFNHPHFDKPEVQEELLRAAKVKVANSDIYSEAYSDFVETFTRVARCRRSRRYFFIEGGALAVEKCIEGGDGLESPQEHGRGSGERGTEILHFRHAFHGRSGLHA